VVNTAAAEMSSFETSALGWYLAHATGWAERIGITAREFERLRLRGRAREIFIRAMNLIEKNFVFRRDDEIEIGVE